MRTLWAGARAYPRLHLTAGSTAILFNIIRTQSGEPYGEGFWANRFGFLDYTGARYIETQEKLLLAQLDELSSVPVANHNVGGAIPKSVDKFLKTVPLTSIDDYAGPLGALRNSPRGRYYTWAYTMYGAGNEKWVPYTQRAIKTLGETAMGVLGMATEGAPDRVSIKPGDRAIYNVPPRPYLAGIAAVELSRRFGLTGVIDPVVAEKMEFKDRIRSEYKEALSQGVDIVVSMSSVLKKISERFEDGVTSEDGSSSGTSLKAGARYLAAAGKAKLSRRRLRPSDLWKPRTIVGWGLDTRHFRDEIARDWGRPPFEMYASTEAGCMGIQYGVDRGIALNPEVCFFEFLPEQEVEALRNDPNYTPRTALLPEVEPGQRYEVVITSFYGMPFVRYRTGHMVDFTGGQLGYGPDLEYVGRADDRLDIGGFTRIDESTIWRAVSSADIRIKDWVLRREIRNGETMLGMYLECASDFTEPEIAGRIHSALVDADPLYADVERMLGWRPLEIHTLSAGTFDRYYDEMRKAGAELIARKPRRVNTPDTALDRLLALSRDTGEQMAA